VRYYKHCDDVSDFVKDVDFLDQMRDSSAYEGGAYFIRLVFVCGTNCLFLYIDFMSSIIFGCDVIRILVNNDSVGSVSP
jgi:hypothetical protein